MSDPVQAILTLAGLSFFCFCGGAAFAFGAVLVCRTMEWAPVNCTVNVIDRRDS